MNVARVRAVGIKGGWFHAGARSSNEEPGTAAAPSVDAVVGRFFGDGDIVHMTFTHAGVGDAHVLGLRAHLVDVPGTAASRVDV